jgi:hypothetical protein
MRLGAAFGVLAAVVTTAHAAGATPSARLVYARSSSAASCPDEGALRKAVAARFGYDPFFAWAKQTVVVQIARDGGRYMARVQIVDEQGLARGTREITSNEENCSELFDAAALAISIALDASGNTPAPPPTADTSPAPQPAAAAAPPAEAEAPPPSLPSPEEIPPDAVRPDASRPEIVPPATPARRGRLRVGLDALAVSGIGPGVASPGVAAFADIGTRPWSLGLELQGDLLLPADVTLPQSYRSPGKVQAALFAATVAPCGHFGPAVVCVLVELGWLQAWGGGVDQPASAGAPFVGTGGRLGLELPVSRRVFLRFHGDAIAELTPPTFELDGQRPWNSKVIGGSLGAGLGASLP